MKTVKGELVKARKQTHGGYEKMKKQVQESAEKIGDYPVDYMKLTKNALKVVVPLVVLKMIYSQYKKAHSNKVKDAFESLYTEVRTKLKNL